MLPPDKVKAFIDDQSKVAELLITVGRIREHQLCLMLGLDCAEGQQAITDLSTIMDSAAADPDLGHLGT